MLLVNVEVRLCQIYSPKKINLWQKQKSCAKSSAHGFYLLCLVYARGAHSTNLLNESGQTCAQFSFCALPNCQLNLVREQKRAQSSNSYSVHTPTLYARPS